MAAMGSSAALRDLVGSEKPGIMNVALSLLVALLAPSIGIVVARGFPRLWMASMLPGCGGALTAAIILLGGGGAEWEWRGGFALGGEAVHLRCDAISALFLALLGVVGGAATVYLGGYWTKREHPQSVRAGRAWWSGLVLSLTAVLVCSNGLHFLIAWEGFAVCAYFLITLDRRQADSRAAGWLYLGASHAATLALFAFFAALAARTGGWDLGPMRDRTELAPLFWLALFGFGLKAGLFPLHIWLPSAHASAPSHVSAMLSGVTIKLGIFGILRFSSWLPVPDGADWSVMVLGVASAVLGVAFALGQHDLKRLLAYHSVENIGIILIGIGFAMLAARDGAPWGRLALAGGLLHVWNHGLFKGLLFLGAGSVLHATGTREMSRLGGLWRAMPWTATLFGLGAVAISGLPPLNGFVSEWLVYLGLFDLAGSSGAIAWAAVPATLALAMTGGLALACFVKACGVVFLGAPRSDAAAHAHECGPSMRGAMFVLAGACVAIGLAPFIFWPAIARVVAEWEPAWAVTPAPPSLWSLGVFHATFAAVSAGAGWWMWRRVRGANFRRAPTWDCGYAVPTARMQYTAGSFAATINRWFAWVLRPERHERRPEGVLPGAGSFVEHTPETVLDRVIIPVARLVGRLARGVRRLQHGRVQTYLLYLMIGVAALLMLVFHE
jgi:hydrogenase-4 component B